MEWGEYSGGRWPGCGVFLLRSQQWSSRHNERQETRTKCSLAQRGVPWPAEQWGEEGLTTALMTHTFGESYGKWFGPLAFSELACPHTASPNLEAVGAAGTHGVKCWTRLQVVLQCRAFGEVASLHQLDDKTLLMAPIKKCECNFLLPVISTVFGILFNRSTSQSWSLLKPSLSFCAGRFLKRRAAQIQALHLETGHTHLEHMSNTKWESDWVHSKFWKLSRRAVTAFEVPVLRRKEQLGRKCITLLLIPR